MATAVARREHRIARPLKVLIPLIQSDLEDGDRAGMQYYADAGDKLIEAKEQLAHGSWGSWLSRNFSLASTVARQYMRLARLRNKEEQNGGTAAVLPRSLRQMDGKS